MVACGPPKKSSKTEVVGSSPMPVDFCFLPHGFPVPSYLNSYKARGDRFLKCLRLHALEFDFLREKTWARTDTLYLIFPLVNSLLRSLGAPPEAMLYFLLLHLRFPIFFFKLV